MPLWSDPPFKPTTIIKTTKKQYRIGVDDHHLEIESARNLIDLEQESTVANDGTQMYVAIEQKQNRTSTRAIIFANGMYDAIKKFQKQHGRHLWLEEGQESQIGIPKLSDEVVPLVKLMRVNKGNIIREN